jgi:hypothetical protein
MSLLFYEIEKAAGEQQRPRSRKAGLTWIKADEARHLMMTVLNRSDSGPIAECGAIILTLPRGDAP